MTHVSGWLPYPLRFDAIPLLGGVALANHCTLIRVKMRKASAGVGCGITTSPSGYPPVRFYQPIPQ